MTRKILLLPASIILLLALALLSGAALGETDAGNYQPGEIIEVNFAVQSNPSKAVAATLKLVYDHSVFELIPSSVAASDTVVLIDMGGFRKGASYPVSFRIHPSAAKGIYHIRMDLMQAGDINEKPVVDLMFESVSVSIGQPSATKTPSPTPIPKTKPTATPKPTSTPTKKPTEAPSRVFEINTTASVNKGKVTVSWTDTSSLGPYQVAYEYVGGTATQSSFWGGGDESSSTVSTKKFVFSKLIPGKTYIIRVWDANKKLVSATITIPSQGSYKDGSLQAKNVNVTITPKYENDKGTIFNVSELKASNIVDYLKKGTRSYGIRYEFTVPKATKKLSYYVQLLFRAPNGYGYTENNVQENYDTTGGAENRFWKCTGTYFFKFLYEKNDSIPTGTYTVEMYWDGMLVNTSTFQVK